MAHGPVPWGSAGLPRSVRGVGESLLGGLSACLHQYQSAKNRLLQSTAVSGF